MGIEKFEHRGTGEPDWFLNYAGPNGDCSARFSSGGRLLLGTQVEDGDYVEGM